MTDQTRYRIVCADGDVARTIYDKADAEYRRRILDDELHWHCGPTCAQSSCIHCRNGKPDKCPVRPDPRRCRMTDQTRYRIVCADGVIHFTGVEVTADKADGLRHRADGHGPGCGPHTVEPVEPVAPDPTCAQSSCVHCRDGKPGACPVRPYPGTVGT